MTSEAIIARLIDEGTTAKLVAEVAMALAKGEQAQAALDSLRAANADRQARLRERRGITPRNVTQRDKRYARGEKESPPDPHKKNTPPKSKSDDLVTPHRLPDDFTVPDDWIEWAMDKRKWSRIDAIEEGECFCRYWQARGRDAARRSWKKTWQNWVVNSRRIAAVAKASDLDVLIGSVERKFGGETHAIAGVSH